MSGETERNISGWTVDTLRAHVFMLIEQHNNRYEARFIAQEKAVFAAMSSAAEAVNKAEEASSRRADKDNEFREQLKDQAQTFMPKEQAQRSIDTLADRLREMDSSHSKRITSVENNIASINGRLLAFGLSITVFLTVLSLVLRYMVK